MFRQARYLTAAARFDQAPLDQGYEVAFAGRSNAGKSSALNALTGQRGLARASKTPGRTQLLQFFSLDEHSRLVDLPGYGYAKVPLAQRQAWEALVGEYLARRACLRGLVLVMDARHPLKDSDAMLLDWCGEASLPVHCLLTKADKLKRGAASATLHKVRVALAEWNPGWTVQLFSSHTREGVDLLGAQLSRWLSPAEVQGEA